MKDRSLKSHGIRNVTAIHWHLPFAALYAKIAPQARDVPKKLLLLSLVFLSSV